MTRICLITPAPPGSRNGNRATAERWARLLQHAGYPVSVRTDDPDLQADVLIALHAWRSADQIRRWKASSSGPVILALTGTDVYHFQQIDPDIVHASMDAADALIGLHGLIHRDVPERYHPRLHVVYQSAALRRPHRPISSPWRVAVVGHLRDEKDPLRAALAVRNLPVNSRIEVVQLGKAHTEDWAAAARAEMARNPRYRWLGECDAHLTQWWMSTAQVMVISSVMEGGANVVSEACVMGLPVIASRIPGNTGLLGEDYPALFPPGDTDALRQLLTRAESSPDFLEQLKLRCLDLARRFTPAEEEAALCRVINRVLNPGDEPAPAHPPEAGPPR